jgi:hypothetical protein
VAFLASTKRKYHICDITVLNKLTSTQSKRISVKHMKYWFWKMGSSAIYIRDCRIHAGRCIAKFSGRFVNFIPCNISDVQPQFVRCEAPLIKNRSAY